MAVRLPGVGLLGIAAAAGVAYAAAENPAASPTHVAALFRALTILSLWSRR